MAAWMHTVTAKVLGMAALALMMYLTRRIDWYAYVPAYAFTGAVPSAAVTTEAVPGAAPEPPPPAGIMERP